MVSGSEESAPPRADAPVRIEALRHDQDRLASLVQPLTPQQLEGPSYHSWTIAQVLGHLGSGAELWLARVSAALNGTEQPGMDSIRPVWAAWDARSPEAQATDSISYNERLVHLLEGLSDDDLARMHLDLFGGERDAAGLIGMMLAEHALHTWDIAVALDPAAQVTPDAVDIQIDGLGFLAGFVGKPQGKQFRLRVRTHDPDREFSLRVTENVEMTGWDGGQADGELRIPAEAFVRLVYGRLDSDHTPAVDLTGPASLDDLRAIFPGV